MAKCTWYVYRSIPNFILILIMCISRSSEVILGVKKGHFEVKNLKHGQMNMIYIWIDCKFCFESNGVPVMVSQGQLRGKKRSFWVKKGHFGSKIGNMAKWTWYAYDSIPNSILILMTWISRSSKGSRKVILGSKTFILRSKISNMTSILNDR